jgi:hypothetical protein
VWGTSKEGGSGAAAGGAEELQGGVDVPAASSSQPAAAAASVCMRLMAAKSEVNRAGLVVQNCAGNMRSGLMRLSCETAT